MRNILFQSWTPFQQQNISNSASTGNLPVWQLIVEDVGNNLQLVRSLIVKVFSSAQSVFLYPLEIQSLEHRNRIYSIKVRFQWLQNAETSENKLWRPPPPTSKIWKLLSMTVDAQFIVVHSCPSVNIKQFVVPNKLSPHNTIQ